MDVDRVGGDSHLAIAVSPGWPGESVVLHFLGSLRHLGAIRKVYSEHPTSLNSLCPSAV